MARKNRYEYHLMKQIYEFLVSATFRTSEDRHNAQRIVDVLADFLDKEGVEVPQVVSRPSSSPWVTMPQGIGSHTTPTYFYTSSTDSNSWLTNNNPQGETVQYCQPVEAVSDDSPEVAVENQEVNPF